MDRAIPEEHAFQPVNSQQITEEDVREFLQSFPEFKDCRFEVEIVQANQNSHHDQLGSNLKDIFQNNASFLDPSTEHSTILPLELRDQYLRVDSINLPFDNDAYTRQQEMYTRVEPDQGYIPPTEEDIRKAVWKFENEEIQQTKNLEEQVNIQPTPSSYYSIQEHHSTTASSKSSPLVVEEERTIYKPIPTLTTKKTPYSPTSNVSSSAASFIDQNKLTADVKPAAVSPKGYVSTNASPIAPSNHTVATTPEKATPVPYSDNEPVATAAADSSQQEQKTDVGELVRRFSQSTFISNHDGAVKNDEEKEENTTMEMQQRTQSSHLGESSIRDRSLMNGYRRTPARRSRTTDSDPLGPRKHERIHHDEHSDRKSYSRRRHYHHHNGRIEGMVYKENGSGSRRSINRKHIRNSPPPPPPPPPSQPQQMSFSKNQKYCYINGEKFRMVDYSNMGNYQSQQPYSLPVSNNAYYPTLSSFSSGVPYSRAPRPCDGERCCIASRHAASTAFPSLRQKRKPQEVPIMWSNDRSESRRRMNSRGYSANGGVYATTNPYMSATPSKKQWNKLVSYPPKSGASARFYNPPYSQFSMWT